MKFVKSIVVASLFITTTAFANCGNDKPVGNGCNNTTTPIGTTNDNRNTVSTNNMAAGGSSNVGVASLNANLAVGGKADNTNTVNASGGAGGSAVNTTSNTATGGAGGSSSSAVSGNTVQSNSEINVSNTTVTNVPRPPVASAIAPNTIFSGGMDSCMGSSTGSVQGMSFGVAIGSTWTDNHCVALRAAVRLNELGFKNTAAARLCAIPEIAEAFRMSGEFDCGDKK